MKYIYFNDRSHRVGIHAGSATDKQFLEPGEVIVVEIPKSAIPFIKTWDTNIVLLSYADEGSY